MAVWAGAETAVKLHIERGDDLDARDEAGLTPLMIAATRDKSCVCRLLIEAGADLTAIDSAGRSAYAIAVALGAASAAEVIELALAQQIHQANGTNVLKEETAGPMPEWGAAIAMACAVNSGARESETCSTIAAEDETLVGRELPFPEDPAELQPSSLAVRLAFEVDGDDLDLSGWEAEEEFLAPVEDRLGVAAHVATQTSIARHVAMDDSADWADFEADLPFHAAPLLLPQDAEGRAQIRALVLRASREGSVPALAVEDACRDANGDRDRDTESLLGVVLNDLGAETDERFEFRSPTESFETFVDPDESMDEAVTVNDALEFLDNLRSRNNEPIRLYLREAQRTALLSAEEEVDLTKAMERAADVATDVLSQWPAGIEWVVGAIDSARRGKRSVASIVSSARDPSEPVDVPSIDDGVTGASVGEYEDEPLTAPEAGAPDLFALGQELASSMTIWRKTEARATLAALALRRSVLIELSDAVVDRTTESAQYAQAIGSLIGSRDRMVRANLRLVIALARKHTYSGVPLDDLIQSGNIGLLAAVDKFDWRRGFRFSTMATWWIRQAISRSIGDASLVIRLPVHAFEVAQRFPRVLEGLEKELERPPTIGQLAERVGHGSRKVELYLRASSAPLPIDVLDEESNLETTESVDPFERASSAHLRRAIDSLLEELGPKPARVLRLRYGIGLDEARSLEEVGEIFGVTRERIRQIESKALRKLKHPTRLTRLSGWFSNEEAAGIGLPLPTTSETRASPVGMSPSGQVADSTPPSVHQPATAEVGKRLSPVQKLLRQATILGIPVEQNAHGDEKRTWVNLTQAVDNRHRRLIRSLLALGFEYRPGKGYWL
jgi:RNA polymerase primary sigma factor